MKKSDWRNLKCKGVRSSFMDYKAESRKKSFPLEKLPFLTDGKLPKQGFKTKKMK